MAEAARGGGGHEDKKTKERPTSLSLREYTLAGYRLGCGFFNWRAMFPDLHDRILKHREAIAKEVLSVPSGWTAWPERILYKREHEWTVIPFCYTFPSNDPTKQKWVAPVEALCPVTWKILKTIPGLRTALLSKLGPGTKLEYHQGWAELSNHVVRLHLPLKVPGDGTECGLAVEFTIVPHRKDDLICFDDSRKHMAFNKTKESRIVLIFDIKRPSYLPKGSAHRGRTRALNQFIQYFESGMKKKQQ